MNESIENRPDQWLENISLAPLTSLKIGGPAQFSVVVNSPEKLVANYQEAQKKNLPVTVLGGGTNVLISDQGIKGLVIINQATNTQVFDDQIIVSSGCSWKNLVLESIKHSLGGLEATIEIPGTVGGAVMGNAGCFGQEVRDNLISAKIFYPQAEVKTLANEELQFGYRDSILKHQEAIVLEATFGLTRHEPEELQKRIAEVVELRAKNQDPLPSCGSTFKSFLLTPEIITHLEKLNLVIPDKIKQFGKLPAKLLISECGLAGFQIGDIRISELNPNFVVNTGRGTAEQYVQMLSLIKQQVRDKFGLQLEEEVRYLGFS